MTDYGGGTWTPVQIRIERRRTDKIGEMTVTWRRSALSCGFGIG